MQAGGAAKKKDDIGIQHRAPPQRHSPRERIDWPPHSTHEQVEKSQATVGRSALGATTSREAIEARPPALVGQLQCAAARATPVKSPTGAGAPSELLVVQWSAWPHRPVTATEASQLSAAAMGCHHKKAPESHLSVWEHHRHHEPGGHPSPPDHSSLVTRPLCRCTGDSSELEQELQVECRTDLLHATESTLPRAIASRRQSPRSVGQLPATEAAQPSAPKVSLVAHCRHHEPGSHRSPPDCSTTALQWRNRPGQELQAACRSFRHLSLWEHRRRQKAVQALLAQLTALVVQLTTTPSSDRGITEKARESVNPFCINNKDLFICLVLFSRYLLFRY